MEEKQLDRKEQRWEGRGFSVYKLIYWVQVVCYYLLTERLRKLLIDSITERN